MKFEAAPIARRRGLPLGIAIFSLAVSGLLAGCAVYRASTAPQPEAGAPDSFSFPVAAIDPSRPWWTDFQDPILSGYITSSLGGNYSLRAAVARIRQARALATQTGAAREWELSGFGASDISKDEDFGTSRRSTAGLAVSWEVDLWGRLESAYQSDVYEAKASEEDYRALRLLLTGEVAETYFQLMERYRTLDLLNEQLASSEEILERIQLRFGQGQPGVTIVDVLQQRSQVESVEAQFPIQRAEVKVLSNRLAVLLGDPPTSATFETASAYPGFSEGFEAGIPSELLMQRPDLRAASLRLTSIDHSIGEAVADQYPRFTLSADSGVLRTLDPTRVFASAMAEAVGPVLDKGRRQSEIDRRRELYNEAMAVFTESFLVSIEEVENALWREIHQKELIEDLETERQTRVNLLNESRVRYLQGGSDYLPVLAALQSLQDIERDLIGRKRELLSIRVLLHLALGGPVPAPA